MVRVLRNYILAALSGFCFAEGLNLLIGERGRFNV